MNKQKSPDGGPTAEQNASRAMGGGSTHARGNGRPIFPARYGDADIQGRADGMPLPPAMAPEAHGGHYYTVEDAEKYEHVIGYDKGLAPGYAPGAKDGEDERGKYEVKPWQSPSGDEGCCLVKMNFDGSRSILAIMAVDPSGNTVQLPPNTVGLKKGWKFASTGDLNAKVKQAEEFAKRDEDRRQAALKAAPAQPAPAPLAAVETPEARKSREDADPVTQALRHGESKTSTERALPTDISKPEKK